MMNAKLGLALAAAVLLSGQSAPPTAPAMAPLPARTSLGTGYLGAANLPDSIALLPPPPAPTSRALRRDERAEKRALSLRGTARWTLATADANLASGAKVFMCAAGISISPAETPKLEALLRRAAPDLGLAGYAAKRKYMRARPFMTNGQPTCTPEM
jgi:acid phosphatase (class A)